MRNRTTNNHSTTDVILPMQDPYMDHIVNGTKNYEFRKYRMKPSVKRIWFYRTAPHSAITHISDILPARTRDPQHPLQEDGLGNAEFNNRHKDWRGYDFAYRILSVYELRKPIPLAEMKSRHGIKIPPRGLVYLPETISKSVVWWKQKLVLERRAEEASRSESSANKVRWYQSSSQI
ncbi:PUA-like domain-containing protein [Cercophora newfieldiana]|uniref:PUA-like domain-containing protein n=1 Tax=Cercophora newfieldiana TaxID=92897 RepID=A0AA39YAY4_9PEZI|nr:PUA-like domain-containing protein [Cercophora newfieldiana]